MKPMLFIDFDGTMCHDRFWRSLPRDVYVKLEQCLFVENKHRVREWMLGAHNSEDVNQWLAAKLNTPYALLWNTFVQDCKTMTVSEDDLFRINALREKCVTILMTGNMDCFSRFTVPALQLDRYFDEICISCDERRFKDDDGGAAFVDAAARHAADLKLSYLIDDSPRACATFAALGGASLRVQGNDTLSRHLVSLS